MKLNELYAFTVVGLRRWPDPKRGEQHSAQELIVTKDPIKHPIKPRRPKKGLPLAGKAIGAKWSPVVHSAVVESIKVELDASRVDAGDVADLVMDIAVQAAEVSMKHKQRKHEKIFRDEDDEPFKHTVEAYAEDAEEFIASVIEQLQDKMYRELPEKVKVHYSLPTEVEYTREKRQREVEK